MRALFHLAYHVHNLDAARAFYGDVMGCREGRSTATWVDFDFFGHQISLHLGEPFQTTNTGHVGAHLVPMPHLGVVLLMDDWRVLADRLRAHQTEFVLSRRSDLPAKPANKPPCSCATPAATPSKSKASPAGTRCTRPKATARSPEMQKALARGPFAGGGLAAGAAIAHGLAVTLAGVLLAAGGNATLQADALTAAACGQALAGQGCGTGGSFAISFSKDFVAHVAILLAEV